MGCTLDITAGGLNLLGGLAQLMNASASGRLSGSLAASRSPEFV